MNALAIRHSVPWILWPFAALWDGLVFLLLALGRLLTALAGLVLMAVGVLFTLTVIGAPLGIPLASLGLLLLIRSIF